MVPPTWQAPPTATPMICQNMLTSYAFGYDFLLLVARTRRSQSALHLQLLRRRCCSQSKLSCSLRWYQIGTSCCAQIGSHGPGQHRIGTICKQINKCSMYWFWYVLVPSKFLNTLNRIIMNNPRIAHAAGLQVHPAKSQAVWPQSAASIKYLQHPSLLEAH